MRLGSHVRNSYESTMSIETVYIRCRFIAYIGTLLYTYCTHTHTYTHMSCTYNYTIIFYILEEVR
jgi:hypothetical protein